VVVLFYNITPKGCKMHLVLISVHVNHEQL
jgi:hypothetical protein